MAAKRRHFTIEELSALGDSEEDVDRKIEILDSLLNRMEGLVNPGLSPDEKSWMFESIIANSLFFRGHEGDWLDRANALLHPQLREYRLIYLLQNCGYGNDVMGRRHHQHLVGLQFSQAEKDENVRFLNEMADEWEALIARRDHVDPLMQKISSEAQKQINDELSAALNAGVGLFLRNVFKKQLLLFYRYIYIRGSHIFRHQQQLEVTLGSNKVMFDIDSFIHLGRHMAAGVKPGFVGKSSFSKDFLLGNTPELLESIFLRINRALGDESEITLNPVGNTQLFFEYNQVVYSVWIESTNVNGTRSFRISSIYPAEDAKEKGKIARKKKLSIEGSLYYFN